MATSPESDIDIPMTSGGPTAAEEPPAGPLAELEHALASAKTAQPDRLAVLAMATVSCLNRPTLATVVL